MRGDEDQCLVDIPSFCFLDESAFGKSGVSRNIHMQDMSPSGETSAASELFPELQLHVGRTDDWRPPPKLPIGWGLGVRVEMGAHAVARRKSTSLKLIDGGLLERAARTGRQNNGRRLPGSRRSGGSRRDGSGDESADGQLRNLCRSERRRAPEDTGLT